VKFMIIGRNITSYLFKSKLKTCHLHDKANLGYM